MSGFEAVAWAGAIYLGLAALVVVLVVGALVGLWWFGGRR